MTAPTEEFCVTFPTKGVIENASKVEPEFGVFSVQAPDFATEGFDHGDADDSGRAADEEEGSIPMSINEPTIATGIVSLDFNSAVDDVVLSLAFEFRES